MLPPGSRGTKIKPPRKSIVNSSGGGQPIDFNSSWDVLAGAIVQIQNKNVSNLSYEQLYRKAYTLVLHKFGTRLYDNVKELIKSHLLTKRTELLMVLANNADGTNRERFLKSTLNEWNEHLQAMKFISDVLMYLNRVYVREQNKLLIYDLGIQLFKDNVIKYNNNEVGGKLTDILIQEITKNRGGEIISTKMYINKIIEMFELLHENNNIYENTVVENYYQKSFEPVFLSSSETFFQSLVIQNLAFEDSFKYLIETDQFLEDEISRINLYLPETTIPKLVDLMDNIMIKNQLDVIINLPNNGLQTWIRIIGDKVISGLQTLTIDQLKYLKLLYKLNHRIDDNCELLKVRLKNIIVNQGKEFPQLIKNVLASSENKESKKQTTNTPAFANRWIESILSYKAQFSVVVKESFDHDFSMEQYITTAIRDFVNLPSKIRQKPENQNLLVVNPSELLSIYMDYHIKQFSKPNSVKDKKQLDSISTVDEFINNSIQFLRFVNDKDAVEAFYKNHFAKRFLNSKGFNSNGHLGIDIEDLVISKLSEELGTTSLDSIIKMNMDIKLSKDITSDWKKSVGEKKDKSIVDLDLKICNVSYWPNSMTKDYKKLSGKEPDTEDKFIWPRYLKQTISQFEQFWSEGKKNDNKSLYWSPKFGSIDLKITYPSKTYEINLSTYAGIIMLLFGPSTVNSMDADYVSPFKDKRKLTYNEIKQLTGIPEADLKRHLQSIAVAPRSRLLIKTPMTKDVNETDVFELNEKFKSPSVKVKVLTVSASSTTKKKSSHEEELEEVESDIAEGRKHEVNAAIVRILKSRQSIVHRDLISETIKQLQSRFIPSNILIKRQLEDLIDKEYLKRDDENRNLFHYIA